MSTEAPATGCWFDLSVICPATVPCWACTGSATTPATSRIAAAVPSNGRMRNTFMERVLIQRVFERDPAGGGKRCSARGRRGEAVVQASDRPAPTAYRRLHLHRARAERTARGGQYRRAANQVWRMCHPPMTVKEKWNGSAKLPLALESRKVTRVPLRNASCCRRRGRLSGICYGGPRPFVGL